MSGSKLLLKPVIDENDWWLIAPKPDLSEFGLEPPLDAPRRNEPNDHHIIQGPDGKWHLWACVRNTKIGRLLAHWEADLIMDSPWRLTGDFVRADKTAGESLVEWHGQEFLQSPYIIENEGTYYMFYGGYATGHDKDGKPTEDYNLMENQISLMTSKDCRTWSRYKNAQGLSQLFFGPGAVRDECVVKFGGTWYMYYSGHHNQDRNVAGIYVRSSKDLINWSDWSIAHYEYGHKGQDYHAESPVVVYRGGWYYLFRSHGPFESGTYVFRSDDPMDFGQGDVSEKLVCRLPVIAPEIIVDKDGNEFITNIASEEGYRIRMYKLFWEEDK